ncbi:MAG: glycosyltransferase [Phycisphaerae bacterium]
MADNINTLVSIITPAYNAGAYIVDAIESVLDQTYPFFEMIVVDDGSTDDTAEKVQAIDDPRIDLIRQANAGVAAARNRAMESAQGTYFAFLDADDLALPQRLEKQLTFLQDHPEVALVGAAAEIWEDSTPTGRYLRHACDPPELAFDMLFENYLVNSTVMVRSRIISRVGGFTLDQSRRHEDFELWSRICRRHAVANLPDVLVAYRVHPGSICRTENFDANGVRLASENIARAAGSFWARPAHRTLAALLRAQDPGRPRVKYEALQRLLGKLAHRLENRFNLPPGALDGALTRHRENLRHHWTRYFGPLPEPGASTAPRGKHSLQK